MPSTLTERSSILCRLQLRETVGDQPATACRRPEMQLLAVSEPTTFAERYLKADSKALSPTRGSMRPWYRGGIGFSTLNMRYTACMAQCVEYSTVNTTSSGSSTNWPRK